MIRRTLFCSAALLALAACGPQTPATTETKPVAEAPPEAAATKPAPVLGCSASSLVNADSTFDSLVKALGPENVVKEMVAWVDSEEEAVILYPKDPTMRAELLWLDKTSGGPRIMRVGGDEQSKWVGPSGLKVGSSLADIEAANGGPFTMVAFENHNSGEANWLGGKLDSAYENCRFGMSLNPGPDTSQESVEPLGGDSETTFRSDSPEMRTAKPVAYEFWIDY